MLIDRKDIEDTAEIAVVLSLRSEALALRCLGHLLEQGLQATMSQEKDLITVTVRTQGRNLERVNFALYLVEQWSQDDA